MMKNDWLNEQLAQFEGDGSVTWFEDFNPFTEKVPDILPNQLEFIRKKSLQILANRSPAEVQTIINTMVHIYTWLEIENRFEILAEVEKEGVEIAVFPFYSSTLKIIKEKNAKKVNLKNIKIKPKALWGELFAAYALSKVCLGMRIYQTPNHPKEIVHAQKFDSIFDEHPYYSMFWVDLVTEGMLALNYATEFNQKRLDALNSKNKSQRAKKYAPVKEKCIQLWEKKHKPQQDSMQTASESIWDNDLSDSEKALFSDTDTPEETIKQWIWRHEHPEEHKNSPKSGLFC